MKRTSLMTAVAALAMFNMVTTAQAVQPGNQPKTAVNPETFNPSTLPGQSFNNQGSRQDPFLPSGFYNPFPSLPGSNPNSVTPNSPSTNNSNNLGIQIQNPVPTYLPPGQNQTPTESKWRLGVMSRDTETGVRVHEIVTGSAAARAGLEVNDVIIAVHGHQVGIVDGQLQELSREFEAHADPQGMVTMLVQDHRSKSLMNVTIQLDSRFSLIQGSLALQNVSQLPRNARLNIELQEVVREGAAPITIARKEIANTNRYPVPFELQYDPAQVSHRGNYILTANVIRDGQSTYKTVQTFRVNSQGHGNTNPIAMQLEPVRPSYESPIQLDRDAQIATIVRWFNEYLGRPPSDQELTVWLSAIQRGYTLRQVQLELLGHNQFFNRCGRDKVTYIEKVHELLVGRQPSSAEMEYWIGRYDAQNGIRRELAREFQDAVGIR